MSVESFETCSLVGIKDGLEIPLGEIPMPPELKLKDLIRSYFGSDFDNEDSDASSALMLGSELLSWMIAQGWKGPNPSWIKGTSSSDLESENSNLRNASSQALKKLKAATTSCTHPRAREVLIEEAVSLLQGVEPT